jgi:hypothetical protein
LESHQFSLLHYFSKEMENRGGGPSPWFAGLADAQRKTGAWFIEHFPSVPKAVAIAALNVAEQLVTEDAHFA